MLARNNINTFEFIDMHDWCRPAISPDALIDNEKSYLQLFGNRPISISYPPALETAVADKSMEQFLNLPSNGGFSIQDLISNRPIIAGSYIANLGQAIVLDSSLLVLVKDCLALTEGYGDKRWLDYQLNTWPHVHNYLPCLVRNDPKNPRPHT